MMQISAVRGNSQWLDGGAMFGNAPKALWSRYFVPDAENRISLACRSLLVERQGPAGKERLLLDTGIGAFFSPPQKQRYGVRELEHVLLQSLGALGLSADDITHVILSHLHFDHAGGLLAAYDENMPLRLLFDNARYVVGEEAFERAQKPHARDRASFISELPRLLEASGRLDIIRGRAVHDARLPGLRFHYSDGHTAGLMLTEVRGSVKETDLEGPSVIFVSDLVPGTAWVHLPLTAGYDRFAELAVDEKTALLDDLAERRAWLFYTHDPNVAMSQVRRDPQGRMHAIDMRGDVQRFVL